VSLAERPVLNAHRRENIQRQDEHDDSETEEQEDNQMVLGTVGRANVRWLVIGSQHVQETAEFADLRVAVTRPHAFSNNLVPYVPPHRLATVAREIVVDHTLRWDDYDGVVVANENSEFSPLAREYFGTSFQRISLSKLNTWKDMIVTGASGGEDILSPRPLNVVCCLIPAKEGVPSTTNYVGASEFEIRNGQMMYNSSFWANHRQFRNLGNIDNRFFFLEAAAKIPDFVFRPEFSAEDSHACRELQEKRLICNSGSMQHMNLRLVQRYATVFCNYMNSTLVQQARLHRFQPLFLFRNLIIQKNRWEDRFMLSSASKGAVTSIFLIGFYRKNPQFDNREEIIALRDHEHNLLTHMNQQNGQEE
jgi:hypothetical protein